MGSSGKEIEWDEDANQNQPHFAYYMEILVGEY
jgi:hypothetical protein